MRKDSNSIGAQFLNVMGLSFDDIQDVLENYYNNQYLGTGNVKETDIIYKGAIPSVIKKESKVNFKGEGMILSESPSLERFLTSLATDDLNHYEIYYNHPYYIDYDKHLIYVRFPYGKEVGYPDGKVTLYLYSDNEKLLLEQDLKLYLHSVWNLFDEFGLLLNTPRLYGEKNEDYKKRLLDVFKHPGNSSKQGMYNFLGRELKLIKEKVWTDGSRDILLEEGRIYLNTIEVDGEKWDQELLYYNSDGQIVLAGNPLYQGISRSINYVSNLSIHALNDKQDTELQSELFTIDGLEKPMLQYYIDIIHKNMPIEWDRFLWGTGLWQDENAEIKDTTVPRFFDAKINEWDLLDV